MKGFALGLALAVSAIASHVHAAEPCRWYVNEFDPLSWGEDRQHGDWSVHFPGHGQLTWGFRTTAGTMNDPIKTAFWSDPHNIEEPMQFYYRSATVDGRKALVITPDNAALKQKILDAQKSTP